MTQIAQSQVSTVSTVSTVPVLRAHRTLVLGVLGALIVLTTALILVIGNDRNSGTSIPTSSPHSVAFEGGPTAGTPSAVSEALGIERVRPGISLTTNVPAPPRVDEGPVAGTPAAVSAAMTGAPAAPSVSATSLRQYIGHHGVPGELSAKLVQGQATLSSSYERQTPGQRP